MRTIVASALMLCSIGAFAETDTRCYELRIYHVNPGKLEALEARFRDHSCALFEKHGFTNVGYWVPVDNKDNLLIYMLSSKDRAAHDKAWKEFGSDPEWQKLVAETEASGKFVSKVDSIYLAATDFSPAVAAGKGDAPRVFELRTYKAAPGKLDALLARFREHTLGLFTKHGMTNIAYWTNTEKDSNQLIYILAHASKEAGLKSFDAFRADPEWQKVKKDSEANGSLTEKVESLYMAPLDFSPLK